MANYWNTIKDKFLKPTILISITGQKGKGSARSVYGFDIGAVLVAASNEKIIVKGGGHKMAGGFTIKEENIPIFRDILIKNFEKSHSNSTINSNLYLDSVIAPSALNEDFFEQVNYLAPFGSGNTEPKFVIENIRIISSNTVGSNHIILTLSGKDGSTFRGFAWNAKNTPLEPYLNKKNKKKISIAGKMRLNEWRGVKKVEFFIEDVSLN